MPFPDLSDVPDDLVGVDPNQAIHANNAAMLAEVGQGDPGAGAVPGMQSGSSAWPAGLAPRPVEDVAMAGLPAHLTSPASTFVPSPEDRDPNDPSAGFALADPATAPTSPDDATRAAMLGQQPSEESLELAISFDPNAHPRDWRGRFKKALHDLKKGETLQLPDGTTIGRTSPSGMHESQPDGSTKMTYKEGFFVRSRSGRMNISGHGKDPADDVVKYAEASKDIKTPEPEDDKKKGKKSTKLSQAEERYAKIYQLDLAQPAIQHSAVEDDGLIWKIACKTGTLALSPGPGQIAVDEPLVIDEALFDDMLLSLEEKALPYCTVPETHANGSLENTGYVRKGMKLSHAEALESDLLSDKAKEAIKEDPDDTFYLLAGIDFTHPPAKEKALNGSIPDTSIGVKFNWRNTRTGKAFRAVWEHLALTPMPWIDGLPAFGMSADRWDKGIGSQQFDAVYIDSPALELAMTSVRQEGSYDTAQARTVIGTLGTGDTWSWNYGISVEKLPLSGPDGESDVWLLRPGYDFDSYGPGDDSRKCRVYTDLDSLMPAVDAAVAAEEARRAAERARWKAQEARGTIAADYSQDERQEGGELQLAESHKLKCPKCDKVQSAKNKTCINCGHDLTEARKAKFAELNASASESAQDVPSDEELALLDSEGDDELHDRASSEPTQETSETMAPRPQGQTVEQLLASQQADLESSAARIAALEGQLQLAHGQITDQGRQLHTEAVNKRIAAAQSVGVSPSLCLAAKTILLADESRITPDAQQLNLSVQLPKADKPTEVEEREIKSVSDVVEIMLSAATTGVDAAQIAHVGQQIGQLHASAHEERNAEEQARAAVEENERKRHPERFNDDGSRKEQVAV